MLFDFNLHSSLLLVGFVQGIIMALVLGIRGWRENKLADRLLALLLLLMTFHIAHYMLGFGGWYDSHDWHSSFMFYFPFHLYLLIGPVLYFYFRSLTNQDFQFQRKDLWHFLPGLLNLVILLVIFLRDVVWMHLIQGEPFVSHFNTRGTWAEWADYTLDGITGSLGMLSVLVYLGLTIYRYHQYRRYLNDHFSATEGIEFHWLRNVLYAVLLAFLFRVFMEVVGSYFPNWSYQQYWFTHFAFAIAIYFISIQGYTATLRLPRLLQFTLPEEEEASKVSQLSEEEDQLRGRLVQLMQTEKPYLQAELNLQELARKINTNPSLLSRVINQGLQQNFNDYINSHRVKAVEQRLLNRAAEQLTLTGIAFDCGFNSKATFNRAFKKFTGKSPREYLAGQANSLKS